MTPKDLEDIRSWRRGEWVADIAEIESMVYGLVDEIDRFRAAAGALAASVRETYDENWKAAAQSAIATHQIVCALTCEEVLKKGRELGLWE